MRYSFRRYSSIRVEIKFTTTTTSTFAITEFLEVHATSQGLIPGYRSERGEL